MAKQQNTLNSVPAAHALALVDLLTELRTGGMITRTQLGAIMDELRDQTPLALTLAMRRPKGVVTVTAAKPDGVTLAFRVNVRAKVLPG